MGDPIVLAALAAAVLLSFANGANDVSKAIATLVGAGVTTYRRGLIWGAVWTGVGCVLATFLATALLQTFVSGWFVKGTHLTPAFALSVGVGAIAWVLVTARVGLPVSTTHSLVGAIVGLGALTLGTQVVAWSNLVAKVAIPLALSPFIGLAISFIILPALQRLVDPRHELALCFAVRHPVAQVQPLAQSDASAVVALEGPGAATAEVCVYVPTFVKVNANRLHWLSSAGIAVARALNDTPKVAAIAVMGALAAGATQSPRLLLFSVLAVGMTAGSLGGIVVTRRMGEKVTRLSEVDGFIANLVTAGLVGVAANFGLPVSTTHVSNGAIVGVGLRDRGVNWTTVRDFVLAWLVTLPAGAVLAILSYLVIHQFLR